MKIYKFNEEQSHELVNYTIGYTHYYHGADHCAPIGLELWIVMPYNRNYYYSIDIYSDDGIFQDVAITKNSKIKKNKFGETHVYPSFDSPEFNSAHAAFKYLQSIESKLGSLIL